MLHVDPPVWMLNLPVYVAATLSFMVSVVT